MTDKFSPISIEQLYNIIQSDLKSKQIFQIPQDLFFKASKTDSFKVERFGQTIDTPLGLAAGPHTQMAQNIISAWLCGARYIELKTIQTLDELEVSKPCIDIYDEGYNCEWSQELKIQQSFEEYLKAWIIIHLLKTKLFPENKSTDIGTIFNISVGYNLEGILKDNVQWFFNKIRNCKSEKDEMITKLAKIAPEIKDIAIPDCISNNVTLSTMHGCPPDEIEKIAKYLITEQKFHTIVKLNPTLLGPVELRKILNEENKFPTIVPDIAFEHDLKFPDAVKIIQSLSTAAKESNVFFGLKLTNTLESENNRPIFPENEKMMYMSGRALHPIAVNVALKLQKEFNGNLCISFSAGADCFNIVDLLNCNLSPITVCSDILKPGGYGRLSQYIEELKTAAKNLKFNSLSELILYKNKSSKDLNIVAFENLKEYVEKLKSSNSYKKSLLDNKNIKTNRKLEYFDCIAAPCVDTCPTNQNIPMYLYHTSQGDFEKAWEVILQTNPFPNTLGMVCDHTCQTKCTRSNYDKSIYIRDVKRFISENSSGKNVFKNQKTNNINVAIIGAGPSGLSAGFFLANAGFNVSILESKSVAGGMVNDAIPTFRLTAEALNKDIKRIEEAGVKIIYNSNIDSNKFNQIVNENQYVYVAVGAQLFKKLGIPGDDAKGVLNPFNFLNDVKYKRPVEIGKKIAVVGGGNTAMDVARTAIRKINNNGEVVLIYRRTINEMPAEPEEIEALIKEGIKILQLTDPTEVVQADGKVKGLKCIKMQLGPKDKSGRPKPIKIENSEFIAEFDSIIPAFGQDVHIDFIDTKSLNYNEGNFETNIPNVFIGGDAYRGAATIVKAVGDGRKVADKIIRKSAQEFEFGFISTNKKFTYNELMLRKAQRNYGVVRKEIDLNAAKSFNLIENTITKEEAISEASRCLYCDEICNICVTVCPNRANVSYMVNPINIKLNKVIIENGSFKTILDKDFVISQRPQVLNIGDFCNECGNCSTFCPTSGNPYIDKPKFYLTTKSFNEVQEGYYFSNLESKTVLIQKEKGNIKTLTLQDGILLYDTDHISVKLNKDDLSVIDVKCHAPCIKEFHLYNAAELWTLMNSISSYYPKQL